MRLGHGGRWTATILIVFMASILMLPSLAGCGESTSPEEDLQAVTDAATAFLGALGDQNVSELRSFMSQSYIDSNGVPDPITREQLTAVLGFLSSYRFVPEQDITFDGDRAVIIVTMDITGKGEREETLVLGLEEGQWKVEAFTALDWSQQPTITQDGEEVEVEQALRDFLIACVDGDTDYIFKHLSSDYKDKHKLEKPWTSAEFSGVFGTARSYDFAPDEIEIDDGNAEVDVTVEFGSRGNLESETSRVGLVQEGSDWLINVFPFFIY